MLASVRSGVALHRKAGAKGTGMVPVGSRGWTHGGIASTGVLTDGGRMSRVRHAATCDFSGAVRLVFGNFQLLLNSGNIEVAGANSIIVRASVEVGATSGGAWRYTGGNTAWSAATAYALKDMVTSGGSTWVAIQAGTNQPPASSPAYWTAVTYLPVLFSGVRDVTLTGGQTVVSDPLVLPSRITKGQFFYTNTLVQPNNGTANTGSYPAVHLGTTSSPIGDWVKSTATAAAPPDYTTTGPTTDTSTSITTTNRLFGPMAVVGTPDVGTNRMPVVFLHGDSWMNGSSDTTFILGSEIPNWATRALTDNPTTPTAIRYGWVISGKGSANGSDLTSATRFAARTAVAAGCTDIIDAMGINDLAASPTLATMQAQAATRWAIFTALGLRVHGVCVAPETTSTDAWATTTNQTVKAGFGAGSVWQQYNAWLRTLPSPLVSAFDVAAAVTDASGLLWAAGYTTDGIHPNQTGSAAAGTALQAQMAAVLGPPV